MPRSRGFENNTTVMQAAYTPVAVAPTTHASSQWMKYACSHTVTWLANSHLPSDQLCCIVCRTLPQRITKFQRSWYSQTPPLSAHAAPRMAYALVADNV